MAKLILGGIPFPRKLDAERYLRNLMNGYDIGQAIPAADVAIWFEVLQKHEWFQDYVEHGIDHFAAAFSEHRPNYRNMVAINAAGEQKPFTFNGYLTKGPLPKIRKVMAAMRTEIKGQISAHRAAAFASSATVVCAISGRTVPAKRCHVHHADMPFLQIVDEFLTANARRWSSMDTEAAGTTGYQFRNRVLAADWQAFHAAHATLQVVSPDNNLAAGANGYKLTFNVPS